MNDELFDNRYRFVKILGEGGFGKVFLAREEHSDLMVAIKQLINEDKERQEAIIYEMQMIAKFNHPHIVTYKHNFVQDGLLFIVMEYCEKGNLRDLMTKEKIPSTSIFKWITTLTDTLQFVHDRKIIHHDIKPDNILVTGEGTLKISDFGIANTGGGTRSYMSPEALRYESESDMDERVDIYALGVTLLELLTGQNPFRGKRNDEILQLHDRKDFGITQLPGWQQEIILKAISKIPEQRFQSMNEFNQAVRSKYVPVIFDKEMIKAGDIAERANILLNRKKWRKATALLEYAEKHLKVSVNILKTKGKYHLLLGETKLAREYFEKALILNPRLDVLKELGWINVEQQNYPAAISLLSDHLHRNPSDFEAYNLLLKCFYETNRYEPAMDLASTILKVDEGNACFSNNFYISCVLHNIGQTIYPEKVLKAPKSENHFLDYNVSVMLENTASHNFQNKPALRSKLLFMDYRFNQFTQNTLYCTLENSAGSQSIEIRKPIIKIGREAFTCNDIQIPGGTAISRRHCLIINCRNDIWLHDLSGRGTYLNNEPVTDKTPLTGRNTIQIGNTAIHITADKTLLF